ncbi:MAG: AAA family ATPase [Propionibacteriales bacterium]|nr:AAA family ATPase [Propionibacteriales bacterium]
MTRHESRGEASPTGATAEQHELAREQAYVDQVYRRLDAAAESARAVAADGHARGRVDNEGGLVERDAMVYQAARRLAALDSAHEGLVFGRLDSTDGEARYIGRIGLRDEDRDVMLIDWRAPAASVFYQATPKDPMDVVRRRVLRCVNSRVVSIEDELLDVDAAPDGMPIVGDGALLAELTRARDDTMHAVVATIQKEQDDAIRAPSRGVTTISGGPGTGKTVVALHRAAYLLYSERRRFETGGVLVVGPSDVYMRYIERVLPSLGETAVTLRSIGEVVDGVRATRHDPPDVATVKGSNRMLTVLRRAVRDAVPGAPTELRVFYRDEVLILDSHALRRLRRELLGQQRRNRAVERVSATLIDALWEQVRGHRALDRGKDDFVAEMETRDAFIEFVDRWWPVLDAVETLGRLADPERLGRYADGVLTLGETELLLDSWSDSEISIEDVPLIDELRYLLGDPVEHEVSYDPTSELYDETVREVTTVDDRRTGQQRTSQRTEDDPHAHVLVDEAQDLSPMQWRMLGRRGRHASWTIVGDPAQSAWPLPGEAELARSDALEGKDQHQFRLSTNYRNSQEIFELAARVGRAAVPDPDLPEAIRRTGHMPAHRVTEPADMAEEIRRAVVELRDTVDGTIGVVSPSRRRGEVESWLNGQRDARTRVLDPLESKGLEFDGVVVVQPGEIATEGPAGLRTLYVVLTRATQRLITIAPDHAWIPRS